MAKPSPTLSGWWASLPNCTASPPTSRHQRTTVMSGHRVRPRVVVPSLTQPWRVPAMGAALIRRVEVAGDVEGVLTLVDEGPIGVLGEGDGGQADLERALAGTLHVPGRGVPRPFGVHVEIRRQGHPTRLPGVAGLEWPPMGSVVLVLTYVFGAAMFATGLYLVGRKQFPWWLKQGGLWPLTNVSPRLGVLQGWAGIGFATSLMAMGVAAVIPGAYRCL